MKKHLRTLEKFGFVFGTIAFVVWGLMQMWQHTNFMRTDASLKKLKSELPKKVDDRTTLVDVDFERYQVMDLKGTNVTFSYVIDLSVDNTPVDLHEMEQSVQRQVCANPDMSRPIKEGDSYSFHYASKEGVSLGDFTITTCP